MMLKKLSQMPRKKNLKKFIFIAININIVIIGDYFKKKEISWDGMILDFEYKKKHLFN